MLIRDEKYSSLGVRIYLKGKSIYLDKENTWKLEDNLPKINSEIEVKIGSELYEKEICINEGRGKIKIDTYNIKENKADNKNLNFDEWSNLEWENVTIKKIGVFNILGTHTCKFNNGKIDLLETIDGERHFGGFIEFKNLDTKDIFQKSLYSLKLYLDRLEKEKDF